MSFGVVDLQRAVWCGVAMCVAAVVAVAVVVVVVLQWRQL